MPTKKGIRRIAVLTGGGDCPGLNAVIRAVTRTAILDYGWEVWGIEDGFEGLIQERIFQLTLDRVAGILPLGGTLLGTSNRSDPFLYKDTAGQTVHLFQKRNLDVLICVGGDGTMAFAKKFSREGIPIVGIPKTIDNDVPATERTVGFYSAVHTATDAIDKLHTTAASHHRVMVIEVMGRDAGWLALGSGLASGADIVLIPEIPFDLKKVYARVRERSRKGRRFTIAVIAEGAVPSGGEKIFQDSRRLGGIGPWLAGKIQKETQVEARAVMLGHLLRCGPPIYQDRILATHFGWQAIRRLAAGEEGILVTWGKGEHLSIPLKDLPPGQRRVPNDHPWIGICRSMGAAFAEAE